MCSVYCDSENCLVLNRDAEALSDLMPPIVPGRPSRMNAPLRACLGRMHGTHFSLLRLRRIDRSQLLGKSRTAPLNVKIDAQGGRSAEWPMVHFVVWKILRPRQKLLLYNKKELARFGAARTGRVACFRALKLIRGSYWQRNMELNSSRPRHQTAAIVPHMRHVGITRTPQALHCIPMRKARSLRSFRSPSPTFNTEDQVA